MAGLQKITDIKLTLCVPSFLCAREERRDRFTSGDYKETRLGVLLEGEDSSDIEAVIEAEAPLV